MAHKNPATRVVELDGRTVIPGLIDSLSHPIRGGPYYNLDLRWDGVPSLADALRMLREQLQRAPPNLMGARNRGLVGIPVRRRAHPTLDEQKAVNMTALDI